MNYIACDKCGRQIKDGIVAKDSVYHIRLRRNYLLTDDSQKYPEMPKMDLCYHCATALVGIVDQYLPPLVHPEEGRAR